MTTSNTFSRDDATLATPSTGVVLMYRFPQSYTWIVVDGFGATVNISSSTTGGLQEAINTAAAQGLPLVVQGGGQKTVGGVEIDWGTINCTTGISIPPGTKASYTFNGVSLELLQGTSADGLSFDSQDMLEFKFRGQIIYTGTGNAVAFRPINPNQENFTGVISSRFDFGSIVCSNAITLAPDNTKGNCLTFIPGGNSISGNTVTVVECNAGLNGIYVATPTGSGNFQNNHIRANFLHNQGSTSCLVSASGSTTAILANTWEMFLNPTVSSATGLSTYSSGDIYVVNLVAGAGSQTGIAWGSSAAKNIAVVGSNTMATPITDNSTAKNNTVVGAPSTFGTVINANGGGSTNYDYAIKINTPGASQQASVGFFAGGTFGGELKSDNSGNMIMVAGAGDAFVGTGGDGSSTFGNYNALTVKHGAPANSLYVSPAGGIAVGTTTDPGAGGLLVNAAAKFPNVGTTASAANAFLDNSASNNLLRSTSSLRYKRDVEPLEAQRAIDFVTKAKPIWYRSTSDADRKDWSWYGLGAEDVAAIEPRLVHWNYLPEDYEVITTEVETLFVDEHGQNIKEKHHETRLKSGAQLVPDSVMYDRIVVMLLNVVQQQEIRIAALESSRVPK